MNRQPSTRRECGGLITYASRLTWGLSRGFSQRSFKGAPTGIVRSSCEGNGGEPLPLLLLALRSLYVYLHIDPESLNNAEFSEPHPSICLGNHPSFACHSRFPILANGIRDERVCEVAA